MRKIARAAGRTFLLPPPEVWGLGEFVSKEVREYRDCVLSRAGYVQSGMLRSASVAGAIGAGESGADCASASLCRYRRDRYEDTGKGAWPRTHDGEYGVPA